MGKKNKTRNRLYRPNNHVENLPYRKSDGSTTGIGRPWYSNNSFENCCNDKPSYSNALSLDNSSNSHKQIPPFSQPKVSSTKDKDALATIITIDYIAEIYTPKFFAQNSISNANAEASAYIKDTNNSNPKNQCSTILINTNTPAEAEILSVRPQIYKNCSNSSNAKMSCIDNSAIIESTHDNNPNEYNIMNDNNFDISEALNSLYTIIDSNNLNATQVNSTENDNYAPCTNILCIEHTKEDTQENFFNIKKLVKNTMLLCVAILFLGILFTRYTIKIY
ncbi:hypothetical protein NEIG_00785 [Nematocida sp. ERTm5]|nr:hypothetical protein NEIG_00785 [Nematocida sp. ERTm5]